MSCGSTCVKVIVSCMVAHVWKYTFLESTHVEIYTRVELHNSNVIIYLLSLSPYITPIISASCHASSLLYGAYKNFMNFLVLHENFE